jgi:hypothetical protein
MTHNCFFLPIHSLSPAYRFNAPYVPPITAQYVMQGTAFRATGKRAPHGMCNRLATDDTVRDRLTMRRGLFPALQHLVNTIIAKNGIRSGRGV